MCPPDQLRNVPVHNVLLRVARVASSPGRGVHDLVVARGAPALVSVTVHTRVHPARRVIRRHAAATTRRLAGSIT